MSFQERITIDPEIRSGKPTVKGTRVTVYDILEYLAGGMTEDQILDDFPSLEREDIRASLAFAAARERRLSSLSSSWSFFSTRISARSWWGCWQPSFPIVATSRLWACAGQPTMIFGSTPTTTASRSLRKTVTFASESFCLARRRRSFG